MQVTETLNEGLKRGFTVVVAASDIEEKTSIRLTELAGQVKLPGFRPGKVPVNLMRQRYGEGIKGEILEQAVNEATAKALEDNKLRPAFQPKVEIVTFEDGKDLEYTIEVEVLPAIEIKDFSNIEVTKPVAEVSDKEVEEGMQRIADGNKTFTKVKRNRKSKKGEALLIDFVGSVDGVEFEGGKGEDHQLELGSGSFIPGFEDQLIGHKGGEEVEVNVTFPENYGSEDLAGKDAVFQVTVKEVREAAAAELNDDFAKTLGLDDLEGLKTAIKEQIEGDYTSISRNKMKRQLLDALAEDYDFDVPPTMIDQEMNQIWHQYKHDEGFYKDDTEHDHASEKSEEEEKQFDEEHAEKKAEFEAIALRRVRLGLLLAEVGDQQKIEISDEEVNRAAFEQARRYPGQEMQILQMFQQNPQMMAQLRAPILEEKVVDYIVEIAKVTEEKVSAEDLLKPEEDDE